MTKFKQLTEEAIDFINEEGKNHFETVNEYIEYIFAETNVSDAIHTLNKLDKQIGGDYILAQDQLNLIGDADEVTMNINAFFSDSDFEGTIYEEDLEGDDEDEDGEEY